MAISSNTTGLRPGVCTSTTRPTAPYEGQMIYTTDLDTLEIWNGSAWRILALGTPTQGSVLQVVSADTATLGSSTSATYADTGLTATITPKATTSKILAIYSQNIFTNAGTTGCGIRLVRGATTLDTVVDLSYGTASGILAHHTFTYLDSPSTTSATTYKTQFARTAGASTAFVQPNNSRSSLILQEIAA